LSLPPPYRYIESIRRFGSTTPHRIGRAESFGGVGAAFPHVLPHTELACCKETNREKASQTRTETSRFGKAE
jgi:hypothetical protein